MTSHKGRYLKDFAALLGGGVFPLSLSPFEFWPLAFVSVAALFWSTSDCSTSRCLTRFYYFNVAMFGVGVSWIYVSIHQYGGASAFLAACLVLLFVMSYSLLCVPLAYVYARFGRKSAITASLIFAALWILQEWFRGWFLTGFPWLFTGYGVMNTPLAGYAPIAGVFGVSLAVVLVSTTLVTALLERRWLWVLPSLVIVGVGFGLSKLEFTHSSGEISVSMVQGNIDQHLKWRPENRMPILDLYRTATRDEWGRDLIVWPEAALTLFREQASTHLKALDQQAESTGSTLILGIPDRDQQGGFQNTVISLGALESQYVKRRLVPFGEYVPLENLLRGVIQFFDLPMSHNRPGAEDQPLIRVGNNNLSASICYEVVYPELVRIDARRANLLLTVSNDSWFGGSIGPWQHLQMARMRSLENGKSLIRSTNNGVTAAIDYRGRVLASLPQFERGVLRVNVEARTGSTPFSNLGSAPVLLLSTLMFLIGVALPRFSQLLR